MGGRWRARNGEDAAGAGRRDAGGQKLTSRCVAVRVRLGKGAAGNKEAHTICDIYLPVPPAMPLGI